MPLLVGVLGKLELFFAGDQDGSVVDQPWTELPDTAVALFLASSRFNRFSSRFARYLACSAFCFLTLSRRSLASAHLKHKHLQWFSSVVRGHPAGRNGNLYRWLKNVRYQAIADIF